MTQSGLMILVIDEEESARQYIIDALTKNGYSVYRQARGNDALTWLQQKSVDLIYISLLPSQSESLRFLEKIRGIVPQTPLIVSSSRPQTVDDTNEIWRAGVADYLNEPLSVADLLQSVIRVANTYPSLQKKNSRFLALEKENRRLKDYVERLEMDQQAGRRVQSKLLPSTPSRYANHLVSYKIIPSLYLSGDFIDYGFSADRYLAFYLTDVSGHGAAPAFVTAWLKQLVSGYFTEQKIFHSQESFQRDSAHLIKLINREVMRAHTGCHLTCLAGVIDTHSGEMRYVVAGHLPLPLLISNGRAEYLEGKGKPLGIFEDAEWKINVIQLPRSQPYSLIIFSDGILEVLPPDQLIEKERYLKEHLAAHSGDINLLCEKLNITDMDTAPDDIAILKIDNSPSESYD